MPPKIADYFEEKTRRVYQAISISAHLKKKKKKLNISKFKAVKASSIIVFVRITFGTFSGFQNVKKK